MPDELIPQSEINPRRRFLFVSLSVISIGMCLLLLTAMGPAKPAFESFLRSNGFVTSLEATVTEMFTPSRAPLDSSSGQPAGTQALTSQAPGNPETPPGAGEGSPPTQPTTPTRGVTATKGVVQGKGRCRDVCNPASPNCLAGLDCVPSGGDASGYICWNAVICSQATLAHTPDATCNFNGVCESTERATCLDCLISWTPAGDFCAAQTCGDARCTPCAVDLACVADCGLCLNNVCGDGICRCAEDAASCPQDCNVCSSNTCGDGTCQCGENILNCPADCGNPPCTCGDGQCKTLCGETPETCSQDCEDPSTCVCGDNQCSAACGENAITCTQDCGLCAGSTCGDGACRVACGETPATCEADCRLP